MTDQVLMILGSIAWLLGVGLLGTLVARHLGIPDLVLFVLTGILLGPYALGLVHLPVTQSIGQLVVTGGAAFMLYEGGRAVDLSILKRIWLGTGLLSVLGVALTGSLVAVGAHLFLAVPWPVAMLVGAVVAPTDPATIVPLFNAVRVKRRIQQLVVSESAFNDATGAVITLTVLGIATTGVLSAGLALATFARLVLVGAVVGVAVGLLIQLAVSETLRIPGLLDRHEENAVATLFAMVSAYAAASALGGSGFMAVFLAGIIRGNARAWGLDVSEARAASHQSFMAFLSTAVRILIFGVLGASVDLRLVSNIGLAGLAVVGVLLFVARPITVAVCLGLDRIGRWRTREILFVSWVRETGVVPAALASLLLATQTTGAGTVAAVTLLAVIATIVVQAPTTTAWARAMGVAEGDQQR